MIAAQLIELAGEVRDTGVKRRLLSLASEAAALEENTDSDALLQGIKVFLLRLQRKVVEEMHIQGAAQVLTVALDMVGELSPANRANGRAAVLKALTTGQNHRQTRAHGHRR